MKLVHFWGSHEMTHFQSLSLLKNSLWLIACFHFLHDHHKFSHFKYFFNCIDSYIYVKPGKCLETHVRFVSCKLAVAGKILLIMARSEFSFDEIILTNSLTNQLTFMWVKQIKGNRTNYKEFTVSIVLQPSFSWFVANWRSLQFLFFNFKDEAYKHNI